MAISLTPLAPYSLLALSPSLLSFRVFLSRVCTTSSLVPDKEVDKELDADGRTDGFRSIKAEVTRRRNSIKEICGADVLTTFDLASSVHPDIYTRLFTNIDIKIDTLSVTFYLEHYFSNIIISPMDLSSLEGPPILDHSAARDPPSVHLAALPSLGLPPRPASADAVSRIYTQSQSQSQSSSHSYSRSQSHLVPYPQIPHPSQSLNLGPNPDSNLPPHYRRARTPSPTPISWGSSSHSPNSSRYGPRAPSPQRLVWLDAEKSWVVVSGEQTSVYAPGCHGCNCGGGSAAGAGMSANMPAMHANANINTNMMPMPTMNIDPAADLYPSPMVDAPPPYEQHVFDKPLVQVQGPGGSRHRRRAHDPAADSGSGSDGEPSRGRQGGSRWTAVARRLRASPVR